MKVKIRWPSSSLSSDGETSVAHVELGDFSFVEFHFGAPMYKSDQLHQG